MGGKVGTGVAWGVQVAVATNPVGVSTAGPAVGVKEGEVGVNVGNGTGVTVGSSV